MGAATHALMPAARSIIAPLTSLDQVSFVMLLLFVMIAVTCIELYHHHRLWWNQRHVWLLRSSVQPSLQQDATRWLWLCLSWWWSERSNRVVHNYVLHM